MLSPEVLRQHFAYTRWASNRLVAAAGELTPDELMRDFGSSEKSVLGTLVHVFAADRIWLRRMLGPGPYPSFVEERDRSLAVLTTEWPDVQAGWMGWAESTTYESLSGTLSYLDLKGNSWTTPLWQIALHVVNHGSHHRGQVSGFLRALGRTPPALDLIAYYRQLKA